MATFRHFFGNFLGIYRQLVAKPTIQYPDAKIAREMITNGFTQTMPISGKIILQLIFWSLAIGVNLLCHDMCNVYCLLNPLFYISWWSRPSEKKNPGTTALTKCVTILLFNYNLTRSKGEGNIHSFSRLYERPWRNFEFYILARRTCRLKHFEHTKLEKYNKKTNNNCVPFGMSILMNTQRTPLSVVEGGS